MHPAEKEGKGKNGEHAVSELIGAILLVSLVVLAMAIISVLVLSQPPPEEVPHLNALAGNSTDAIFLYHNGGDSLAEAATVIHINNDPTPVDHSLIRMKNEDGTIEQSPWSVTKTPWSVGKTLIIGQSAPPESVTLVSRGSSSQSLILKASFTPSITGPIIPTTSPTATPTATATTTVTTTVTTTIPTTNTTTPVPTMTPVAGNDTILNTQRGGYVEDGSQIAFRAEPGTSSSYITIGGIQHNFVPGDVVSLLINGDSTNVEIDMNDNHISRFSFPDVSVYREGTFLARGQVTDIWISEFSSMTSSLTLIVPSHTPVWTNLVFTGNTIINGDNGQRIEIYNLYPKTSNKFMRLAVQDTNTYYDGGATGYHLT